MECKECGGLSVKGAMLFSKIRSFSGSASNFIEPYYLAKLWSLFHASLSPHLTLLMINIFYLDPADWPPYPIRVSTAKVFIELSEVERATEVCLFFPQLYLIHGCKPFFLSY